MSVISDLKMILENATSMCITDAKTYTEERARFRDVENYVSRLELQNIYEIRYFANRLKEAFNQEIPLNYSSTQPYFTLESVRALVDTVVEQALADMKKG